MSARSETKATAQEFLEIHDITNDLVILKDGTTCFILTVGAMNFGLLAEEEQDAIIYTYAALLNSLNYPIQIVIQSQTKDVTNYLNLLKQKEEESQSTQKKERIARYRGFVTNLIQERNVLDKNFYVSVPATPLELGLLSVDSVIPGRGDFDINKYEKPLIVDKAQSILEPRRDHLISQFARIGLYSRQLTTQEIIKVFYTSYNPEASEGFGVADSSEYQTAMVKASLMQDESGTGVQAQTQAQTQAQAQTNPVEIQTNKPELLTQSSEGRVVLNAETQPQQAVGTSQTTQVEPPPIQTQPKEPLSEMQPPSVEQVIQTQQQVPQVQQQEVQQPNIQENIDGFEFAPPTQENAELKNNSANERDTNSTTSPSTKAKTSNLNQETKNPDPDVQKVVNGALKEINVFGAKDQSKTTTTQPNININEEGNAQIGEEGGEPPPPIPEIK
jgi:hypothetical protein